MASIVQTAFIQYFVFMMIPLNLNCNSSDELNGSVIVYPFAHAAAFTLPVPDGIYNVTSEHGTMAVFLYIYYKIATVYSKETLCAH